MSDDVIKSALALPEDAYEMNVEPVSPHPQERRVTVTFYTYGGRAYKYAGEIEQSWEDPMTLDRRFVFKVRQESFLSEERIR